MQRFRLHNAKGESTFVKFRWRPRLGLQSTVWDAVQLFTEKEADAFSFDHLDATKLIPEELVPLSVIGTMQLDRWPDNFFAETEQAAFCPANVPPGIDFSNDPLLQSRLFSYLDTQLIRLFGPNFHQLQINAPKCPFANLQRDDLGLDNLPPAPPAAVKAIDMPKSPGLQLIGKMKDTLEGRCVGILMDDGSDPAAITSLRKAVEGAGSKLADGRKQAADGQLAGTPSVVFDAVALVLSADAGKRLAKEAAAVGFVRDAFGHLKAIAANDGAQAVLKAAGIASDAGVVDAGDAKAFVKAAKTRQWAREPKLRTLA